MKIALEPGPCWTFLLRAENGASRLVQHDTDFPGIARTFGWPGKDDESPAAVWDAYEFIELHMGESADDPGYF